MDYTVPYWHPAVVHFPIALLLFGAVAAVAYAAVGRAFWRRVTLLAVAPGALMAWAANETGEALYDAVEGTPIVEELVGRHETLGEWTLWIGALAAVALAATEAARRRGPADVRDPLGLRLALAALVLAAAVLVTLTGRLGGTMVWGVAA